MGGNRSCGDAGERGTVALNGFCVRVVPGVPSFSVDEGFWYREPDELAPLPVGALVRIPLGGRRVRGYVVERAKRDPSNLKPVAARSGEGTVFDSDLMESLRWAAQHYVAPVAVMLERAAPPNVPPASSPEPVEVNTPRPPGAHPFDDVVEAAKNQRRRPPLAWIAPEPPIEDLAAMARGLGEGSLVVVVPTGPEASALASAMRSTLGREVAVVHGEESDREITAAWSRARTDGGVLVGTPKIASWMVRRPVVAVIVEDGRRAMKDRQTPTVHARDLLRARAMRERFPLIVIGPTPSIEIIGAGAEIRRPRNRTRAWALVEVVDRREDPPGGGLLAEQSRRAIQGAVSRGRTVFVYAHRRGYAAAVRCVACRTIRRCPECGSRPDPGETCSRCGAALGPCNECGGRRFEPLGAGVGRLVEEVARISGRDLVEAAPADAQVLVGTERDLAALARRDLVVLVDLDGLTFGTNFRAAEEALRIGARLACRVRPDTGNRLMVQTSEPEHPVVVALRRGDPLEFLQHELTERRALGYPPAGELLVIELRGSAIDDVSRSLEKIAPDARILGPAAGPTGERWLIQGEDLSSLRRGLRSLVQRWRDSGATVRVDADPIDL